MEAEVEGVGVGRRGREGGVKPNCMAQVKAKAKSEEAEAEAKNQNKDKIKKNFVLTRPDTRANGKKVLKIKARTEVQKTNRR